MPLHLSGSTRCHNTGSAKTAVADLQNRRKSNPFPRGSIIPNYRSLACTTSCTSLELERTVGSGYTEQLKPCSSLNLIMSPILIPSCSVPWEGSKP